MANLFIEVLRSYMREKKFKVHDFVVMPNHVHVLLTLPAELSIEKAVQMMKGNFSYRAKKELGYQGEIWQKGFSEVQVLTEEVSSGISNISMSIPSRRAWRGRRKNIRIVPPI